MERVPCDFCGSVAGRIVARGQDRQLDGDETFFYIQCAGCGLIRLDPRPAKQDMHKYYPANYAPYTTAQTMDRDRIQQALFRRYQAKKCRFVERWKPQGHVLDIGCATGEFLAAMKERGWETTGVELTPQIAAVARQQYGLNVLEGDFVLASLPAETFDVITMWDVLEHTYSPTAVLTKCHELLVPGGFLLITLPNLESFDARLFGAYWSGLDFPRHLYVFPTRILRAVLTQVGFQWQTKKCVAGSYGAWALSLKALIRARMPRSGSSKRTDGGSELVWRLISKPYLWFADLLSRGSQATVVCQKPLGV
ncbi:MAG: class I SAM-dependent methyltransferase [Anaerolineae bacterium]|nr:class I SAM-dependent methyltransferase [Anaerolineae bacterium]